MLTILGGKVMELAEGSSEALRHPVDKRPSLFWVQARKSCLRPLLWSLLRTARPGDAGCLLGGSEIGLPRFGEELSLEEILGDTRMIALENAEATNGRVSSTSTRCFDLGDQAIRNTAPSQLSDDFVPIENQKLAVFLYLRCSVGISSTTVSEDRLEGILSGIVFDLEEIGARSLGEVVSVLEIEKLFEREPPLFPPELLEGFVTGPLPIVGLPKEIERLIEPAPTVCRSLVQSVKPLCPEGILFRLRLELAVCLSYCFSTLTSNHGNRPGERLGVMRFRSWLAFLRIFFHCVLINATVVPTC